jgi:ribosome biogenesis SPOUT family RNA methylase Rps3
VNAENIKMQCHFARVLQYKLKSESLKSLLSKRVQRLFKKGIKYSFEDIKTSKEYYD